MNVLGILFIFIAMMGTWAIGFVAGKHVGRSEMRLEAVKQRLGISVNGQQVQEFAVNPGDSITVTNNLSTPGMFTLHTYWEKQ